MSVRVSRSGKKKQKLQTFTYFVPAPPQRKNGYREKEFDKIMTGILQSGLELVDLKTESVANGIFILALLSPKDKKAEKLDEHLDMHEKFKLKDMHTSPDFILDEEND